MASSSQNGEVTGRTPFFAQDGLLAPRQLRTGRSYPPYIRNSGTAETTVFVVFAQSGPEAEEAIDKNKAFLAVSFFWR